MILRILVAVSAGLAAVTAVVIGYPGDLIPQYVILGLLVANAFVSAVAASLAMQPPMEH